MVKDFGREILPAELCDLLKKQALFKSFYLPVLYLKTYNYTYYYLVIWKCRVELQSVEPCLAASLLKYRHLVITATLYWLIQKFSQSFSHLKSPLIYNIATLVNTSQIFDQFNRIPVYL